MTAERLDELDIPLMVSQNTSRFETAFCVSIEAKGRRRPASRPRDRATTVRRPSIRRPGRRIWRGPGHMFPLRARDGGVMVRAGQTEAAVDLARIAGLYPAGVICEIMNEDGTMARVPELAQFARRHGLLMITIADLIKYRMRTESLVKRVASAKLPTDCGDSGPRVREPARQADACGARVWRHRRRQGRARARPFAVPDGRRAALRPLRLRGAARCGHGADRAPKAAACCCT